MNLEKYNENNDQNLTSIVKVKCKQETCVRIVVKKKCVLMSNESILVEVN